MMNGCRVLDSPSGQYYLLPSWHCLRCLWRTRVCCWPRHALPTAAHSTRREAVRGLASSRSRLIPRDTSIWEPRATPEPNQDWKSTKRSKWVLTIVVSTRKGPQQDSEQQPRRNALASIRDLYWSYSLENWGSKMLASSEKARWGVTCSSGRLKFLRE